MPGFNRRDISYVQARSELLRAIDDEFISDLPDHDRGERVAEIVRDLKDRYPDLDDQLGRRLMGEGMTSDTRWNDPL